MRASARRKYIWNVATKSELPSPLAKYAMYLSRLNVLKTRKIQTASRFALMHRTFCYLIEIARNNSYFYPRQNAHFTLDMQQPQITH